MIGTFVARVVLPLTAIYAVGKIARRTVEKSAVLRDEVNALNAECNELTAERNTLLDRVNDIKDQNRNLRRELAEAR